MALLFSTLAEASTKAASTRSRLEKRAVFADVLRRASPEEIAGAVGWLAEEPVSGPIGLGFAQLGELARLSPASSSTVTVAEVEETTRRAREQGHGAALEAIGGLLARMTARERQFFIGSLTGSLRQGSSAGLMVFALAEASGIEEAVVRRVVMLEGSVAKAAEALLGTRRGGGIPTGATLLQPLAPMLALSASSVDEVFAEGGALRVEWKVDGLRAQVHKRGETVRVFSRQGNDITAGCRALAPVFAALRGTSLVLDGEVVAEDAEGKVLPFQDSFSAIASGVGPAGGVRLRIHFFDCLHRDGKDLLDEPLAVRALALEEVAPKETWMPAIVTDDVEEARRFDEGARALGHEGVLVKALHSPYRGGARGGDWRKVKAFDTADLVVLAVERGSGRRKGFLSNLHLGARREDGTFCMVGKTFKGLTDELLRWQTERLGALAVEDSGYVVRVRPELVVEVRFNGVQRSPRYPGGIALRFARVVRYREDKPPPEAEPISRLVAMLPGGPPKPLPKKRQLSLFGSDPEDAKDRLAAAGVGDGVADEQGRLVRQ